MRPTDNNQPSMSEDLIARCRAAVAQARKIIAHTHDVDRVCETMAADIRRLWQDGEQLSRELDGRTARVRERLFSRAKIRHRQR